MLILSELACIAGRAKESITVNICRKVIDEEFFQFGIKLNFFSCEFEFEFEFDKDTVIILLNFSKHLQLVKILLYYNSGQQTYNNKSLLAFLVKNSTKLSRKQKN